MALHAVSASPIKLRDVRAAQGVTWIRQGLRVFFRRPIGFCGLFLVFLVVMELIAALIPGGVLLSLGLLPFTTLGFMIAAQNALAGRFPLPSAFVEPLRHGKSRNQAHLKLVFSNTLVMLAIGALCWAVGGDAYQALNAAHDNGASTEELIRLGGDPNLTLAAALFLGLRVLAAVPFWHAPALVHWGGQSAAQAVFSSSLACWRNKGSLMIFGIVWVGLMTGFFSIVVAIFGVVGLMQAQALVLPPAVVVFASAFYASLYFSFVDSFEPGTPAEHGDQGIASRIAP